MLSMVKSNISTPTLHNSTSVIVFSIGLNSNDGINILRSYMVYSQIWLNFLLDDTNLTRSQN
jgi:hypothetical protein